MSLNNLRAKMQGAVKSWTIRANALVVLVLYNAGMIQENLPQLAPFLPPVQYQRLTFCVIVLNIALRFRTTKSLAEK